MSRADTIRHMRAGHATRLAAAANFRRLGNRELWDYAMRSARWLRLQIDAMAGVQ